MEQLTKERIEAAIKTIELENDGLEKIHKALFDDFTTALAALKLAQKVMGEPSDAMIKQALIADEQYTDKHFGKDYQTQSVGAYDHYIVMRDQMLKELESGE